VNAAVDLSTAWAMQLIRKALNEHGAREGVFMINKISRILQSALLDLFQMQPDVLETTSQTTMTEWNLAHHYANSLSKYLFWYDNDNDVVKRNYDSRRPDIIFHMRQTIENNFLVVEMKKSIRIDFDDIKKIKDHWFIDTLRYRFGACVSVNSANEYKIKVFENNAADAILVTDKNTRMFAYRELEDENSIRTRFREIMAQRKTVDLRDINTILDKYQI